MELESEVGGQGLEAAAHMEVLYDLLVRYHMMVQCLQGQNAAHAGGEYHRLLYGLPPG